MKTKYTSNLYSFYDVTGMKLQLEHQAEKGWFLDKITNNFWRYRKGEPKKVSYAVSYYAKASLFEPQPSEEQKTFQEFCEYSGWHLVAENAKLQVFCNERENPVPIYTDAESEIDAIQSVAGMNFFYYWLLVVLYLMLTGIQITRFRNDPIAFLADFSILGSVLSLFLLTAYFMADMVRYYRWRKKARAASQMDQMVPTSKSRRNGLPYLLAVAVFLLIYGFVVSGHNEQVGLFVFYSIGIAVLGGIVNSVRMILKKRNTAKNKNRIITLAVDILLSFALVGGMTAYSMHQVRNDDVKNKAHMLISLDQVTGMPGDGKGANVQYHQSPLLTQNIGWQGALSYCAVDVHADFMYDFCLKEMQRQKEIQYAHHDTKEDSEGPFAVYQKINASDWGADCAWQLYVDKKAENTYLLQYGDRIVELDLIWTPSAEERARIAEGLRP